MSAVVRSWLAFAAVAAGIIHLALAVSSSLAIPLAVLGVLEFGWGLFAMAAARLAAPRATIAGAFVAVAASVCLLFFPDPPTAFPLLVAALFEFFIAVTVAVHVRSPRTAPAPSTRRYVLGLLAGGIVVAALTLPALASTTFEGTPVSPSDFIDDHGH